MKAEICFCLDKNACSEHVFMYVYYMYMYMCEGKQFITVWFSKTSTAAAAATELPKDVKARNVKCI